MTKILKPPRLYDGEPKRTIFLAGSIEMGKAEDWQSYAERELRGFDVIFNPRRDDWDLSMIQSKDNPQFREQVDWELFHITNADVVLFNFDGNTKSPITLLELGIILGRNMQDIYVVCPENFYRKGNVDITCDLFMCYNVYTDLNDAISAINNRYGEKNV